jgi:hypothetical protein
MGSTFTLYGWLEYYNTQRPHQGKRCQGKTPMVTFLENLHLAKEKLLDMNNGGRAADGSLKPVLRRDGCQIRS